MARYRRLGHADRCQIYALLKQGATQQQIAEHLGVSQSSISRELARNSDRRGYNLEQADSTAVARQRVRARPRKLTTEIRRTIVRLLREKRWSPEQISDHLATRGIPLSHESIYRLIWHNKLDGGDLWCCLRRRGKRYNKRADKTAGRGIIPGRVDISCRPKVVEQKRRIGDWEGDTVLGRKRRGALLTLVERKSQLLKLALLPAATAEATHNAILRKLQPIRKRVHTITFDNGKEFAAHQAIGRALKSRIYFARPYHAWERGLNENTNGLIRDFFPKETTSLPSALPRLPRSNDCSTPDHAKRSDFNRPERSSVPPLSASLTMHWLVESALIKTLAWRPLFLQKRGSSARWTSGAQ